MTPPLISGAPLGQTKPRARGWLVIQASWLALAILLGLVSPAQALSAADFPPRAPVEHVLDRAQVLSRASAVEIERRLQAFADEKVDAKVITVNKLDYDLSLEQLGEGLLRQWGPAPGASEADSTSRLLLLIDAQTRSTAVVASEGLNGRLPADLLASTADTTMALPLRSADRYRQATLDALTRLATVLQGGEDPGEPLVEEAPTVASNIPSKEETQSSNAFTWVVVLLVIGTVVPMATWWVFSR
ncbi:MAG: TPM domain-containing protein [Cyanobacteriota bacterium]|nr:TPM domain-containing protein [Cyanobacteriota bacterium]